MSLRRNWFLKAACTAILVMTGCSVEKVDESSSGKTDPKAQNSEVKRPSVAFVTNGVAAFWTVAEAGCKAAARDFDTDVTVLMPPEGAADQKRMLEELINKGVDGVAVSPINSDNQADILQQVAQATNLITHDSDAPNIDRLAYIGMDNYQAGRMCGQLVKEALPSGGEVMIFVGRLGQLNAELRRQGVIDELLGRSPDPTRRDPTGQVLRDENSKYVVLDTRTDNFDFSNAKSQAEDAIVRYPNLGCMVGLFSYNPPAILEAVAGADRLGEIKVVAFDEETPTLQAIQDGTCVGTIVQDPYNYGYQSVKLLSNLARGNREMLPTNKERFIDIPAQIIRTSNVVEFWTRLKALTEGASASG